MRSHRLSFIVLGFNCVIGKVLLVREFLSIFSGNELILGLILASWLLGVALGSWIFGYLEDRVKFNLERFASTLVALSIILPSQILFIRLSGWWLVPVKGEMPGVLVALYSTFLILLPFCTLYGFIFALGCKVYSEGRRASFTVSEIYVSEASGDVLGALLFTFLLVNYLRVLEIAVGLSLLNLVVAATILRGLTPVTRRGQTSTIITVSLLFVGASALVTGVAARLDEDSYQRNWAGMGLVHHENSMYGNIAVTMREGQLDVWLNGLHFLTAPDPDSAFIEDVAHLPLLQHLEPKRVLLIGEGLGGVLRELLKHPVEEVYYVELDPLIIVLTSSFSEDASNVLLDPRVQVVRGDGRLFVKTSSKTFDVVIVNLPAPSTLQLNRFYSVEFFSEVYKLLEPEGLLSLTLPSSEGYVVEEQADRNRSVYEAIKSVFPSRLVVPGHYDVFIMSPRPDYPFTLDPSALADRLKERGVENIVLVESYLIYKLSPTRMSWGSAYLQANSGVANSDTRPLAVFYDVSFWSAMFHAPTRRVLSFLEQVDVWYFLLIPVFSVAVFFFKKRQRVEASVPVHLVVLATGFNGMTLGVIVLYSYQTLWGYLFHEVGLVSSTFMMGIALGGWLATWKLTGSGRGVSILTIICVFLILYTTSLPFILNYLSYYAQAGFTPWVRVTIPLLNSVSGLLTGMVFPLASSVYLESHEGVGKAAGRLYAFDLLGAFVGALASGIWLIPLYGVRSACLAASMVTAAGLIQIIRAP